MASSSRPQKLQKLNDLRRSCPYVSQSALQTLLTKIEKEGMPELKQSKAMKEATRAELNGMNHYGPLLVQCPCTTTDNDSIQVWMANPLSLLAGCFKQGGGWASMLQEIHTKQPSSVSKPWDLLLYADEVIPGNALAHRQERKTWAIYGSFSQFKNNLVHEDTWFVITIARSAEVNKISGGISQVFSKVLECTFLNPKTDPRLGLLLPHHSDANQDIRHFFTMGGWVQDGLAMKCTFSTKGDSGDKFCMLCSNIRSQPMPSSKDSQIEEEDILGSTITKLGDCVLSSDQEVLEAFAQCKANAGTMSAQVFQMYQQASGITYCQDSLLHNQAHLYQIVCLAF